MTTGQREDTERTTAETAEPEAPHAEPQRPEGFSAFRTSLSTVQMVVGLTTGLLTISGTLFSASHYLKTPAGNGQIVAVVQGRGDHVVRDAVVEVLADDNTLLTTIVPNPSGQARLPVQQGAYILRVSHPRLGSTMRIVEVRAGRTSEVKVSLPGPDAAPAAARRAAADTPPSVVRAPAVPAERPAPRETPGAVDAGGPLRGHSQAP